jgi:hypothetical protein
MPSPESAQPVRRATPSPAMSKYTVDTCGETSFTPSPSRSRITGAARPIAPEPIAPSEPDPGT